MHAAAKAGNRHLAFMSLISANAMFSEIDSEVDIVCIVSRDPKKRGLLPGPSLCQITLRRNYYANFRYF